jgi:hypothetical protein
LDDGWKKIGLLVGAHLFIIIARIAMMMKRGKTEREREEGAPT